MSRQLSDRASSHQLRAKSALRSQINSCPDRADIHPIGRRSSRHGATPTIGHRSSPLDLEAQSTPLLHPDIHPIGHRSSTDHSHPDIHPIGHRSSRAARQQAFRGRFIPTSIRSGIVRHLEDWLDRRPVRLSRHTSIPIGHRSSPRNLESGTARDKESRHPSDRASFVTVSDEPGNARREYPDIHPIGHRSSPSPQLAHQ